VVVVADLVKGNDLVSQNLVYIAPTKEVHLPAAQLKVETTGAAGKYTVRISSPVLARSVYLSFGKVDAEVSDNYFNILPGESLAVTVKTKASAEELKSSLKVVSLVDAFPNGGSGGAVMRAAKK